MNDQNFAADSVIFRPGSPGKCAYLIKEGEIELLREGNVRVAKMGPGEVFGEMSLIEERPRSMTAKALTRVKLTALAREEFEKLLTADPDMFRMYLKALFERLRGLSASEINLDAQDDDIPIAEPVIDEVSPTVVIHPLTRKAAETLPDDGLEIPKFPFRIGRASEDHEMEPLDLNDLWLLDVEPFNISRNHAAISIVRGSVVIGDRGSHMGMYVNDELVGGSSPRRQITLDEGDNVVVMGGRLSPYQFRIHVAYT